MSGATIGPYRVVRELGQGGMGTVVLAEDTRLGRYVALKTVSGTQAGTTGGRAQLLDEARAAAAITHPAIAAVHDVVEHDGDIAIVFEYVEGETLAARLAKGPLGEDQAVQIAIQLADALGVAHGHGVLHRDLKPSNIMLAPGGVVKILDFGIARFRPVGQPGAEGDEGFMGTPGYVAPEQWVGKPADQRSDLYALGVVIFEMITGKRPFPDREPFALARAAIERIARRMSSLVPHVSPALDKLVARLLAADPALRPPHARVVADALRSMLAPPAPAPGVRWRPWAVGAAVAVAAGAAMVWALTRPVTLDVKNPVIAVLPFANVTGNEGNDYLAAGVADSLVTSLASLPTVTVLSRSAVEEARARRKEPGAVARDLGATFVVEGTVQGAGPQLRLGLNLLRQDGSVAWAVGVEGAADSVFDMQARLAAALGGALSVQMSPADRARLSTPPTSNADALDAYWRGRAMLERRDTAGNLQRAAVAFGEALRLDAGFVDAHVALGEAYWELYNATRDPKYADAAVRAGQSALQLAPEQPSVRFAYARGLVDSGRNADAVNELQRTLALQPNNDEAHRQLGRALAALGRLDEGLAEWRRSIALRPNNWQPYAEMGRALLQAARYDEARESAERLIALQPDNVVGYQQLGAVYQTTGDTERALKYYDQATAIAPAAQVLSNVGILNYDRRDYAKAAGAFRRAIALRPNEHRTHRNLGDSLLKLGQRTDATASYRKAAELAEAQVLVNPASVQDLSALALYLQKAGDGAAALRRVDDALRQAPKDPQVWYRAAAVHALAGRRDAALAALQQALSLGFSRARVAADDDFGTLREQPRFAALVAS